jgi:hypothetical protein
MEPMNENLRYLYHVTTVRNLKSILDDGIDPEMSAGMLEASWYVERAKVLWSIAHISARHEIPTSEVYVCRAQVNFSLMKRTNQPGVYYTFSRFGVEDVSPASYYFEGVEP